jgi:hypothetical protein
LSGKFEKDFVIKQKKKLKLRNPFWCCENYLCCTYNIDSKGISNVLYLSGKSEKDFVIKKKKKIKVKK